MFLVEIYHLRGVRMLTTRKVKRMATLSFLGVGFGMVVAIF